MRVISENDTVYSQVSGSFIMSELDIGGVVVDSDVTPPRNK